MRHTVSSATLQIPQSKWKFPFVTVGLVLVALSLLGFIYVLIPKSTNDDEIDLGSKLQFEESALSGLRLIRVNR